MTVKRLNTLAGSGIINLTGNATDRLLLPGETAYLTYSGITSLALPVILQEESIYEIDIIGDGSISATSSGAISLKPNNTVYTNAFKRVGYYSQSNDVGERSVSTDSAFNVGFSGAAIKTSLRIYPNIKVKAVGYNSIWKDSSGSIVNEQGNIFWDNSVTAWSSLGVLTFPFSQSGKVVIRRIL